MGEGNAAPVTKCVPTTACYVALSASVLHINSLTCFNVHMLVTATFVPLGPLEVPGEGRRPPAPGVLSQAVGRSALRRPGKAPAERPAPGPEKRENRQE